MTEKKISFFHGSPGTDRDFDVLSRALSGWERVASPTAPVWIGYSWGCARALLGAPGARDLAAMVFIAPYLFPKKGPGLAVKVLLGAPGIGDFILRKKADSIVDELLERSSQPQPVPPRYLSDAQAYRDPAILKKAALEKEGASPAVQAGLEAVSRKGIPVLVISGEKDQTSLEQEQLDPLRKTLKNLREVRVSDGGHALLWTHERLVAESVQKLLGELK